MKLLAALLILLVILTGILGPQAFFVVDETQLAVVTRFGDPRREITEPGLYVKTPFVDTVNYFERRWTLFDAPPDALLTSDKKRLVIDAYALGRIQDPLKFFKTLRTQAQASTRVVDLVSSNLRQEIADDQQEEIIKTSREPIMNRVRDAVGTEVTEFGLVVVDVRIKRADFPSEIATSVYERMKAERKRIADAERAEGAKTDLDIRATADKKATIIRADAERDANLVRGDGEAEAIRIFADALKQDPEFYAFQRTLEAYKNFLTQNTTVVLPADSDLFQFLQSPGKPVASSDGVGSDALSKEIEPGPEAVTATEAARALLSSELGIDPQDLTLVLLEEVKWPDASLGCPVEGTSYAQVITPGHRMIFEYNGDRHEVHSDTSGEQVVLCDL